MEAAQPFYGQTHRRFLSVAHKLRRGLLLHSPDLSSLGAQYNATLCLLSLRTKTKRAYDRTMRCWCWCCWCYWCCCYRRCLVPLRCVIFNRSSYAVKRVKHIYMLCTQEVFLAAGLSHTTYIVSLLCHPHLFRSIRSHFQAF